MIIAQSSELPFQLITQVAGVNAASQTEAAVDEIWYLFGYPDAVKQAANSGVINKVVGQTGGDSPFVNILAAQRSTPTPLVPVGGVWVLARIPTLIVAGGPILDNNLINDGFLRFIYDRTSNVKIYSRFNNSTQLRIILNGVVIFDGNPTPGAPTPLIPQQNIPNTNAYTPQGVHFDGMTGLVTAQPLMTKNTGIISFAGWFNLDPSLSGQLEFSQGSGGNTLFFDTPLPAQGAWCHMMGTIDAGQNELFLFVNGAQQSGSASGAGGNFSSAPTNGTTLYIGTDTQGNFFKGDIADLSIWFDVSFIPFGRDTFGKLVLINQVAAGFPPVGGGVLNLQPIQPSSYLFGLNVLNPSPSGIVNNIKTLVQPDVFLSGPVSQAFTPQTVTGTRIQTIQNLNLVTGSLTNSSTNPGLITVVPT